MDAEYVEKSALRRELEHIGLSESVMATAEQGLYTDEQLEKLKVRKMELNRVIADTLQATRTRAAIMNLSANPHEPPNTDGAFNSIADVQQEVCGIQSAP